MESQKRRKRRKADHVAGDDPAQDDVHEVSRQDDEVSHSSTFNSLINLDQRRSDQEEKKLYSFNTDDLNGLLEGINKKGFSIVRNPEQLKEFLPQRKESEIKVLIEKYWKKAKHLGDESSAEGEDSGDDDELTVQDRVDNLRKWYKTIETKTKMDSGLDLSDAFIGAVKIMQADAAPQSSLNRVYQLLVDCLEGTFNPNEMGISEKILTRQLLDDLERVVQQDKYSLQEEYLQSGRYFQKTMKSSTVNGATSSLANHTPLRNDSNDPQEPNIPASEESTSNSQEICAPQNRPTTCREAIQLYIKSCLELPKIKRVSICLNPLQIPPELRVENQNSSQ